jgi:hypothetical protein
MNAIQLESQAVPQADVIWDVVRVPEAVRAGAIRPAAVAEYIGAKVARQGIYYTQAARILGLVTDHPADEGAIQLTPYGRAFLLYDWHGQRRALRHLMLRTEPMRSVVQALMDEDGQSLDELAALIQRMAPLAHSTARRRASTVANWLCNLGLARWSDNILIYSGPQLNLERP